MIVEGVVPITDKFEASLNTQLGGASATVTNKVDGAEDKIVSSWRIQSRRGAGSSLLSLLWVIRFRAFVSMVFVKRTQFVAGSDKIAKLSNTSAGLGMAVVSMTCVVCSAHTKSVEKRRSEDR